MIRVCVCDDNIKMMEDSKSKVMKAFEIIKKDIAIEYYGFCSSNDVVTAHERLSFDIIFSDIDMPDYDGFAVADILVKKNPHIKIIYVTSYDNLAIKAYRHNAIGFIRKDSNSINEDYRDFAQRALDTYIGDHNELNLNDLSLDSHKLMWCEKVVNYVIFHSINGDIKKKHSISKLEKQLKQYWFCRIDRGKIVNLYFVQDINKNHTVTLYNNDVLDISPGDRYKKTVEMFIEYRNRNQIFYNN